jgi:anti-sigma factor RsiW
MAKRRPTPRTTGTTKPAHQHEKGGCLRILRELSAYIDDELSADVCRQIRRHLGACPHCEDFLSSLRQTVSLCRHAPAAALSPADRTRMREKILQAARAR